MSTLVAVLGFLGPIVVWLIKRYWDKKEDEKRHEERKEKEQKSAEESAKDILEDAKKINESIAKQREAAKNWGKE